MAKRGRRTYKQQAASRRNLINARRRRRAKVGIAATVGTAAVLGTGIVAYRRYDRKQEAGQKAHLSYKAWQSRMKLDIEDDADVLHASMLKPHPQPRRYRNQPASRQTKFALQHHRKKVLGNHVGSMVNSLENVITKPSPYQVIYNKRHTPKAPYKPEVSRLFGHTRIEQRIGSHTHLLSVGKRR